MVVADHHAPLADPDPAVEARTTDERVLGFPENTLDRAGEDRQRLSLILVRVNLGERSAPAGPKPEPPHDIPGVLRAWLRRGAAVREKGNVNSILQQLTAAAVRAREQAA